MRARIWRCAQTPRATLKALLTLDLGPGACRRAGAERAASARALALAELSAAMRAQIGFLDIIRDTLPQAILVGDSTQPVYAGNLGFAAATPGSWFNSATGYGTLGYALPASTGAGLAAPERPVVCLVGDGGIQFSLGELAVPRDVGAWAAIVIWNNRGYGEIKTSMLAVDIDPVGVDVQPPDFSLHRARLRLCSPAHRQHRSLCSARSRILARAARWWCSKCVAEAFE